MRVMFSAVMSVVAGTVLLPGVGRVEADDATLDELGNYAGSGDAERYDARIEDFRSADGHIEWRWSLVEQLRPSAAVVGDRDAVIEASRRASEPLLMELRAAGVEAYDMRDVAHQRLPSKRAAEILVGWLDRTDDGLLRARIAMALTEPRFRSIATWPLLDLFRRLSAGRGGEGPRRRGAQHAGARRALRRGRRAGARPAARRRPQLPALGRRVHEGPARGRPLRRVPRRRPPRDVGAAGARRPALRARAPGARAHRGPAGQTRGRSDEAQRRRDRIRFAQKGLEKLDR